MGIDGHLGLFYRHKFLSFWIPEDATVVSTVTAKTHVPHYHVFPMTRWVAEGSETRQVDGLLAKFTLIGYASWPRVESGSDTGVGGWLSFVIRDEDDGYKLGCGEADDWRIGDQLLQKIVDRSRELVIVNMGISQMMSDWF
ncbi:hypothetical protein PM082_015458 [Marasmius tenuissimus]|nr:hypothetical protein PM082_015458 [Marasmius tenuissimus]